MANTKRVKITVTAFYDINMDEAQEDYSTTDPAEMLAIDQENANKYIDAAEVLSWADEDPTVVLSWEN